ncbi:MAG TPA: hypothetical protein VF212_15955 [Longimicrobiales bacterium]
MAILRDGWENVSQVLRDVPDDEPKVGSNELDPVPRPAAKGPRGGSGPEVAGERAGSEGVRVGSTEPGRQG